MDCVTRRLAFVASATLAVLACSAPAPAADACWQRLVRDWSADAVVDGRYPVTCYREAIANLPVDLQTYSSAPTDIEAALQARILEAPAPEAAAPSKADRSTGRSVVLPVAMVAAGVVLLIGFLAVLGFFLRRSGRFEHSLDTRGRP